MNRKFSKIKSFLLFALGLFFSLFLLIAAIILFFGYSDANMTKKISLSLGLLLAAAIFFYMTLTLYESMVEISDIEEEIEKIEKKIG